jgi:hypothetical protein
MWLVSGLVIRGFVICNSIIYSPSANLPFSSKARLPVFDADAIVAEGEIKINQNTFNIKLLYSPSPSGRAGEGLFKKKPCSTPLQGFFMR